MKLLRSLSPTNHSLYLTFCATAAVFMPDAVNKYFVV